MSWLPLFTCAVAASATVDQVAWGQYTYTMMEQEIPAWIALQVALTVVYLIWIVRIYATRRAVRAQARDAAYNEIYSIAQSCARH